MSITPESVRVRETGTENEVSLWSLVLLAASIPHTIQRVGPEWLLMVHPNFLDRAALEIDRFEEENLFWPPPAPDRQPGFVDHGYHPPTILIMGALLVFYVITGPSSGGGFWFTHGEVDAQAILRGHQWWRLVTALTLHADPVHLLGNLLIGGVIVHFLCRITGTGLGWLLIVFSGVFGNLLNIWFRGGAHLSIGFSTAVFGAVGILSGFQVRIGSSHGLLAPLGAGLALLALLGSSGERTDLGAHLWGFAVGVLLGAVTARIGNVDHQVRPGWFQPALFILTVLFVVGAWGVAFWAGR